MKAAVKAVRVHAPARIIVAGPVGSPDTCHEFADVADAIICARAPETLPPSASGTATSLKRQTRRSGIASGCAGARGEALVTCNPHTCSAFSSSGTSVGLPEHLCCIVRRVSRRCSRVQPLNSEVTGVWKGVALIWTRISPWPAEPLPQPRRLSDSDPVALGMIWFRAARTVLIPIALAILISFALEPVVAWLERRHVHRVLASAFVVLLVVGGTAGGIYSLKEDAARLAEALPKAAERARDLVTSQIGTAREALDRATAALGSESSRAEEQPNPTGTSGQMTGSLLERVIGAIFAFAGHLVVVIFLVFFLLISGHHVRNRLIEVMDRLR